LATITFTPRLTSSSAITGTRSYCPSAQRYSTATFWPDRATRRVSPASRSR